MLGALLLLGWPGLLEGGPRWAAAGALALLQPLLHLVVQRAPAPRTLAGPLEFLAAAKNWCRKAAELDTLDDEAAAWYEKFGGAK